MIIGSGMLAKAFAHHAQDQGLLIFAGGVSDSTETRSAAFLREERLLRQAMSDYAADKLIYFSTCSIYDSSLHNSVYVQHKSYMEHLVRTCQRDFIIFRLPQVVGVTQSPTIVNFLYRQIIHQQPFELWSGSKRNLLDVDDVVKVIDYILDNQLFKRQVVNLASPQSSCIYDIVAVLESLTQKRAVYTVADKGAFYHIDLSQVQPIYHQLGIEFDADYVSRTISKYYANV